MRIPFSLRVVRPIWPPCLVVAIFLALTLVATLGRGDAWAAPDVFAPYWVTTSSPTHLWSGSDHLAVDYGSVATGFSLLVVSPLAGSRLFVYVPATRNYAYVDAISVSTGRPPAQTTAWHGRVAAELYVRAAPSRRATLLKVLPAGSLVQVVDWVEGEEVVSGDWTWARFADGTYGYGEALLIVPPSSAPSSPAGHPAGRWIDVNLLQQTVTAYEGSVPVHLAIASTGSPGWETSLGTHLIQRRVPDERMRGSSLNLTPDRQARATYDIPHVRYTQYFSAAGEALHQNYWLADTQFGIPHSHGCVGLRTADAAWFWAWTGVGTPVVVHAS
jgi:L,D-transpeptidase catalytic domain